MLKDVSYIRHMIFCMSVRLYVRHAQTTPIGFWNSVEWTLLVKSDIIKIEYLEEYKN